MVTEITDNIDCYRRWAQEYEQGYMLNLCSGRGPAMLHRTNCMHIFPAKPEYGDFTKKTKICADRREDIEARRFPGQRRRPRMRLADDREQAQVAVAVLVDLGSARADWRTARHAGSEAEPIPAQRRLLLV